MVLHKPHHVTESERLDVQPYLVVDDSHTVFVLIHVWVIRISERILDPTGEWVDQVLIVHPMLLGEDVFHHLQDDGSFQDFEYSIW